MENSELNNQPVTQTKKSAGKRIVTLSVIALLILLAVAGFWYANTKHLITPQKQPMTTTAKPHPEDQPISTEILEYNSQNDCFNHSRKSFNQIPNKGDCMQAEIFGSNKSWEQVAGKAYDTFLAQGWTPYPAGNTKETALQTLKEYYDTHHQLDGQYYAFSANNNKAKAWVIFANPGVTIQSPNSAPGTCDQFCDVVKTNKDYTFFFETVLTQQAETASQVKK